MSSILEKIVRHKLTEIEASKSRVSLQSVKQQAADSASPLDFVSALSGNKPHLGLIAEVKKASPSRGVIRADFDPVMIAKTYAAANANCISVLTDEEFFQGQLQFLRDIRKAVDVPLLRKDFVLDEYQVFEARAAGADAVLLIAECLEPSQLIDLHGQITALGMTALVELYDADNVDAVLACKPNLVGVNNRDLNTFEVNLQHSIAVRKRLPKEIVFVSESGIATHEDVRLLESHDVDAMLVGETLMRAGDISAAIRKLRGF